MTSLIEEPDHQQHRVEFSPQHLFRRLKRLFVVSCGLGIAALSGWGGLAYKASSANLLSGQIASLIAERNAIKAQRDAALYQLKQLQQPPQDVAQIDARLNALEAEYNRLWTLAKMKPSKGAKEVDTTATGTIRKASSGKQAR